MSVISDYKSAPFDVFVQPGAVSNYTGTATPPGPGYTPTVTAYGGVNQYDTSYDSICGTRFNTNDGRQVIMVRNGGTEIAAASIGSGLLVQAPAEITTWNNLAITVPTATPATAGTYQILVTNAATKLNINEYANGYAIVSAGTGIGQTLQIASHAPAAASATFLLTLQDPIQVTLDATSTITLVRNPYIGVVVSATGLTGTVVGASFYAISAGTASVYDGTAGTLTTQGQPVYAMVGCHGIWGVRMDATGTPAVGLPASASTTTAGDATVFTAAKQYIGNMAGTATSAKIAPVDLKL
jgi:hypothetical protein